MAQFKQVTFRAIAHQLDGDKEVVYTIEAAYDVTANAFIVAFQLPIEGAVQTILVCGRDQTVMKTAQNQTRLVYRLGEAQPGIYVTEHGPLEMNIQTTSYEWTPRSVKYHYYTWVSGQRTGEHTLEIQVDVSAKIMN